MSALGQKRTFRNVQRMSALPPKADTDQHGCDVRFVPEAVSRTAAIFYCYSISWSARPSSGSAIAGPSALRFSDGTLEEIYRQDFKFNAVQQLRAVACFNLVCFIFVTP